MNKQEYEQKIKDQEIYIVGLQYQIQQLKHKLEHFENYQREKCCECCQDAVVKYQEVEMKLFHIKQELEKIARE